jgi:hypothetical protein
MAFIAGQASRLGGDRACFDEGLVARYAVLLVIVAGNSIAFIQKANAYAKYGQPLNSK